VAAEGIAQPTGEVKVAKRHRPASTVHPEAGFAGRSSLILLLTRVWTSLSGSQKEGSMSKHREEGSWKMRERGQRSAWIPPLVVRLRSKQMGMCSTYIKFQNRKTHLWWVNIRKVAAAWWGMGTGINWEGAFKKFPGNVSYLNWSVDLSGVCQNS
jgi:hypothetical protein